jgi:hypothetical protein
VSGYTDEQVAMVVHAANSALQQVHGDEAPSLPWDCESPHTRASAVEGVRQARKGLTPEQLHEAWVAFKREGGWHYGEVKDPGARTHPCMVLYMDLPPEQKVKDAVFGAVVRAMSGADL